MNGARKKFDVSRTPTKMGQVVFMRGEVFERKNRARRIPKTAIVRPRKRRGAIASFRRRLTPTEDVPASGQIVFRAGSAQILR